MRAPPHINVRQKSRTSRRALRRPNEAQAFGGVEVFPRATGAMKAHPKLGTVTEQGDLRNRIAVRPPGPALGPCYALSFAHAARLVVPRASFIRSCRGHTSAICPVHRPWDDGTGHFHDPFHDPQTEGADFFPPFEARGFYREGAMTGLPTSAAAPTSPTPRSGSLSFDRRTTSSEI